MQVLPTEILQRQVCSECSNYLTVMPITQMKNGKVLCSRQSCFEKSVILNDGAKSLLNTVMESFQFPCVNYLEGCLEKLSSTTSEAHEIKCKYELHECFFCSYKGNWGQIVHHMTIEHPSNVTKEFKFCFKIGADSSQEFVYFNDNDICFISVNVTSEELIVVIKNANVSISHINPKKNMGTITFWPFMLNEEYEKVVTDHIDLFSNYGFSTYFKKQIRDLLIFFKLGTMLSCKFYLDAVDLSKRELELEIKNVWFAQKIDKLSQEIKENKNILLEYQTQKNTIEALSNAMKQMLPYMFSCNNCKTIVDDVLFICDNKHIYCKQCVTAKLSIKDCSGCSGINKTFMGFNRIEKLSTFNFNCDWAGCNQVTTMTNFLSHKRDCSYRIILTCPVLDCHTELRTVPDLKEHWHFKIPLRDMNHVDITKNGCYNWYWLIGGKKLYFVDVKCIDVNVMVNINAINYYDVSKEQEFKISGIYDTFLFYPTLTAQGTTLGSRFIFSNVYPPTYKNSTFSGLRILPQTKI